MFTVYLKKSQRISAELLGRISEEISWGFLKRISEEISKEKYGKA